MVITSVSEEEIMKLQNVKLILRSQKNMSVEEFSLHI